MKNLKRAFTLIELLVVIAIIGILSTIGVVSFNSARKKARDARRKSDIKMIQKALEMYFVNHGQYPRETLCKDTSIGCDSDGCGGCSKGFDTCKGTDWCKKSDLKVLVSEGYLSKLPIDYTNRYPHYYMYEPSCNQGPDSVPVEIGAKSCAGKSIDTRGKGCAAYCLCAIGMEAYKYSNYCIGGTSGL